MNTQTGSVLPRYQCAVSAQAKVHTTLWFHICYCCISDCVIIKAWRISVVRGKLYMYYRNLIL